MNKFKQGFTLIELLVVIAIIALLSSIVMASLSTARMKARDTKRLSDLRQISIALELYMDSKGKYPSVPFNTYNSDSYASSFGAVGWDDFAATLKPYIGQLPKDPINNGFHPKNTGTYAYAYGWVGDGTVTAVNTKGVVGYDLFTQLETPNHPLSCGQVSGGYRYYFNQRDWCGLESKQIYAIPKY